jgi:hypothetical protein
MKFKLHESTGKWVHVSTICRTIHKNSFTRKKVQVIALQRSEEARVQFMAEVSASKPDMLIWVDVTGSDRRKTIRQFGYSVRGMRAVCHHLSVGGKSVSAIPVLTTRGIENVFTTTGTVNGEDLSALCVNAYFPLSFHLMAPIPGQS